MVAPRPDFGPLGSGHLQATATICTKNHSARGSLFQFFGAPL